MIGVRIAFVLLLGLNGLGVLLYAAFWAVLPPAAWAERRAPSGATCSSSLPFLAIGLGVILVQLLIGTGGIGTTVGWLVALIAVGAGLIWHQADPERRRRWRETMPQAPWLGAVLEETDRRAFVLRFIGGGVLVAVGLIGVVAVYSPVGGPDLSAVLNGVIFALVGLAGVASWPRRCSGGRSSSCAPSARGASASRSAPSWPRWCTTRCCTRWR